MRTMLKIVLPVEKANEAFNDGTLGKRIESFMEQWKPEAAYFFPENGKRTALFVLDLKEPSQIVQMTEMFFLSLDAEVSLMPVMNAQDLRTGMKKTVAKKT
jgi:hypothetical protein